jgi:hypothetical protein
MPTELRYISLRFTTRPRECLAPDLPKTLKNSTRVEKFIASPIVIGTQKKEGPLRDWGGGLRK